MALDFVEPGLAASTDRARFQDAIREKTERLRAEASACVDEAGVWSGDIKAVFLTGGSSRVPAVRHAILTAAPTARAVTGSDFLSVAAGLTHEAAKRFGS